MAQGPRPGLPGSGGQHQGQGQPIQIDAKSLEVHDRNKQATFSGDVKVVQGDTTMTCKTLVVFYGQELGIGEKPVVTAKTRTRTRTDAPPDAQSIRRIEARGDVTVLTKDQSASGDLGVYDVVAKTITLTGNVVVTQGKNVIHGGRVVVNTVTGNAHVEAAPGVPDGRVRALIIPSKDNKGGQTNFMTIGPGPSQRR
jgi:lipopolysaccharide export system protein LptA